MNPCYSLVIKTPGLHVSAERLDGGDKKDENMILAETVNYDSLLHIENRITDLCYS